MKMIINAALAISLLVPRTVVSQTNYYQTLGPFQSCYSSTPFTFTATPPTTGNGKLVFYWGACYMSGPASILRINLNTSGGLQQVVYTTTTQACIGIADSVTIPSSILMDAIQTGGGTITGTLFITDYCTAGWGCTNFNDPEVFSMTLSYTSHSTNFTASSQGICPGGTVQFTDQSINNPVSWEWQFPGGNPATSNLQNPAVTYDTTGTWDVTLIASDGLISDTLTMSNFINVYASPVANAGADTSVCSGDTVNLAASGGSTYIWTPDIYLSDDSISSPLAYPVNTISYSVTVTDQNGCTGTDTVTVNVNPLPLIITQASANPICLGDTTMIVAVGAQVYNWTPSTGLNVTTGQTVFASPFNSTTYTVVGTDFNGCVNSQNITIIVNPLPPAPSITQLVATLYATPSAGYQWFLNGTAIPGANSQTYNFSQNGTYTVMITDSNGCESISLPYNVTNTGISSSGDLTGITLHPNPVSEMLYYSAEFIIDRIEITDLSGRKIMDLNSEASRVKGTIDVKSLSRGNYLLILTAREKRAFIKFVKH